MKTSYAPAISISRRLTQPKRAGPFITIRTSTFVELLGGHAREWDAKYPALAGASRAYLIESFAFADNFCSLAAEEERPRRPGVLARRVKKFLLYGALFLALLSPSTAKAQDYWDYRLYTQASCYGPDWSGWRECVFWHGDGRGGTIQAIIIAGIPIPADYIYVPDDWAWWIVVEDEGDGTSTITAVATPGYEIHAGGYKSIWIFPYGAWNTSWNGGYIASGDYLAGYGRLGVPSW